MSTTHLILTALAFVVFTVAFVAALPDWPWVLIAAWLDERREKRKETGR